MLKKTEKPEVYYQTQIVETKLKGKKMKQQNGKYRILINHLKSKQAKFYAQKTLSKLGICLQIKLCMTTLLSLSQISQRQIQVI